MKYIHAKAFLGFLIGLITAIFLFTQCSFRDNELSTNHIPPVKFIPELPTEMDFAGEEVPLKRWEVNEAFDRELLYNYNSAGNVTYVLKLSFRYFPLIESILKEKNIPDDFKYLCVAESNLQNQVSKVGAAGFWQFMKDTSTGFDMEVNDSIDERYELTKSTQAACKYFKLAYQKFGSWTAAAASYNCGMGGYNKFSTFQQSKNYYDLQLPDETNKYIFRILTFKYLMTHAKEMGFDVNEKNSYQPMKTRIIKIDTTIPDLAEWAKENNTTYKMVKIANPWLRSRSLEVKNGKSYEIKIIDQ